VLGVEVRMLDEQRVKLDAELASVSVEHGYLFACLLACLLS